MNLIYTSQLINLSEAHILTYTLPPDKTYSLQWNSNFWKEVLRCTLYKGEAFDQYEFSCAFSFQIKYVK